MTGWCNIMEKQKTMNNHPKPKKMNRKIWRGITLSLIWMMSATLLSFCSSPSGSTPEEKPEFFTNPILEAGADPYVYLHSDGYYYCMVTRGDRLKLWKSRSFTDLKDEEGKEVWYPPESGSNSCCIWAPEIHYLDGVWYIYYSATDGSAPDDLHRGVHVLRNQSEDPFEDAWEDLGMIETRYPGIDGHVFDYNGQRYFAYSPYIGNQSGIMLARMTSPVTIEQETNLGLPIYDWEKTPPRAILEGPQFLEGPGDKLFIIYSAGACWDDNYGLGLFAADKNADLLDPVSWERSTYQVFEQFPDSSVYGPGHNCFTKSPDMREDWIVYHAKRFSSNQCEGRSMRAQKFFWDEEGMPVFGKPVSVDTRFPKPSGLVK
jgi:GH43 family beta-xylosidase